MHAGASGQALTGGAGVLGFGRRRLSPPPSSLPQTQNPEDEAYFYEAGTRCGVLVMKPDSIRSRGSAIFCVGCGEHIQGQKAFETHLGYNCGGNFSKYCHELNLGKLKKLQKEAGVADGESCPA